MDANVLIAELPRVRGRKLVKNPGLNLFIAAKAWEEAVYELPGKIDRIIRQSGMSSADGKAFLEACLALVLERVEIVEQSSYLNWREQALLRIPRDPGDWPTVALALSQDMAIWTNDQDFFGCGLPVWTTETLLAFLESNLLSDTP
ncbi:PIN domain-containing protein [Gloeobacter kilaueensis]|uniref:PIN domain-containing protein n=1 Tax=Gloeobacter kilaueensis TaxID=1416614 RepID=UPI001CB6FF85|nr:PIN domain-containing protein [Gloeobacter kilaueensis]